MNQNESIVFYQTSNGTYHAASPQDQIFETSNIQLPLPEAPHQYQKVFDGNIIEAEPLQQIKIINADELVQTNNIIHNVVQTETENDNVIPLHSFIRVSAINAKSKGFQLITDHIPEASGVQTDAVNTSFVKTINMNGTITRTVLVPQSAYARTQVDTCESTQYVMTNGDISAYKPKPNIIGDNSYLVQNNEGNVTLQLMDAVQPNGKIYLQRIRRKHVKIKNGAPLKNVRPAPVKSNGIGFKVPIGTITPLPLGIKPMKKIIVQPETMDVIGVEAVQNGQLHVITDVGNTVPVNIDGQKNVIYESAPQQPTQTKIIYKIMQPEDFKLCTASELEEAKKIKRPIIKPKPSPILEKTISLGKVITRSGRQVRPPKHITNTYNNLDGEDLLEVLDEDTPSSSKSSFISSNYNSMLSTANNIGIEKDSIEPAVKEDALGLKTAEIKKPPVIDKSLLRKKRIKCIACKKVYSGVQCMGKHLLSFPDHATTERLNLILEKYKAHQKAKEAVPKIIKPTIVPLEPQKPPVNGLNPSLNPLKKDVGSITDDFEIKEDRNIFVSLVGIIERTSEECKAAVFARQLSALILKLKRLMPCLLFEDKSSSPCMINESVGKMLEVKPGKYRLNMNAIKCPGEQGGNCPHIPPKPETTKVTPSWLISDQNNLETSNVNTLITSNHCQGNKVINKWASNVKPKTDDKWTTDNDPLNKWKSPNKSKKKMKSNSQKWPSTTDGKPANNEPIHGGTWSSITNTPNGQEFNKWTPISNNEMKNDNTESDKWNSVRNTNKNDIGQWSSIANNTDQDSADLPWTSTTDGNSQNKHEISNWAIDQGKNDLHWSATSSNSPKGTNDLSNWKADLNSCQQDRIEINKWPSTLNGNSNDNVELNKWSPKINGSAKDKVELNKWSSTLNGNNTTDNKVELNKWPPTINGSSEDKGKLNQWSSTVNTNNCQDNVDLNKWSHQDKVDLNNWSSAVTDGNCQNKWSTSMKINCKDKVELNEWPLPIGDNGQNKNEWLSAMDNDCQEKDNLSKWSPTINKDKNDAEKWPPCTSANSEEKDELDKWNSTTNNGKRKWIPIGTRDPDENSNTNDENWLSTNSDLLLDNATFPQTVDNLKNWNPLQKQSRLDDSTPRSPWQASIPELNKIDIPQEIIQPPNHINSSASQPVPSDDSLTFDCSSKMVEDIHSNLVFDMNKDISLDSDVDLKKKSIESHNFDFNDSRFDMQIDSEKLNFTSAQYNEMKYGPDTLPPFSKIETPKTLQIPGDSLSDISSDADKLPLPPTEGILSDLGSESLGLTISNDQIEPMDTIETRKDVTLNQSEDSVHCDDRSLLNSSDLNLPISNTSNLSQNESILSVSESSLDGTRINLLDSLATDCLSFTDSDLRNTSQMSLDLQDLFPFHSS